MVQRICKNQRLLSDIHLCYDWHQLTFYTVTSEYVFSKLFSLFKVLRRRICLIINIFFSWWSFTIFLLPYCAIQGWYCIEKLDAVSLWGQRARNFSFVFATLSAKFAVFFVQRNIDGVNNCTVDSNLTFIQQILYSITNQVRICPFLY